MEKFERPQPKNPKDLGRKIVDAWFDPKSFESQAAYERIGVRTFKRWMPSTGDYINRYVWKKFGAGDQIRSNDIDSLRRLQSVTRTRETIHVSFLALGVGAMALQFLEENINAVACTAVINILVNVYPIMVQRYNRLRLYRNIDKMEIRNTERYCE